MQYKIEKKEGYPWLDTLIGRLCESGLPDESRDVYKGRNRVVAYRPPHSGTEVNIKAFRRPIAINRMAYGWLRKSKARRSYEHALRLRAMGIGTPLPYCYVEEFDCKRFLQRSYYISEQLGEEWNEIRFLEQHDDCANITGQLAGWIAEIHRQGVLVKDLSPGNVMIRSEDAGQYSFQLVDINRMSFGCDKQELMLGKAARLINSEECMRQFARKYAQVLGKDAARCEQVLLKEYYNHQARMQKRRNRKSLSHKNRK